MRSRAIRTTVTLLLLVGCANPRQAGIAEPPETVAVVWKREGLERPPLEAAPQAVRAFQPVEWLRASYRSFSSAVLVDAWRMPSEAVAFEARQRWRSEPGAAAFHHGDLFIVCSSAVESTKGLAEFSAKLEAEWLATGR